MNVKLSELRKERKISEKSRLSNSSEKFPLIFLYLKIFFIHCSLKGIPSVIFLDYCIHNLQILCDFSRSQRCSDFQRNIGENRINFAKEEK